MLLTNRSMKKLKTKFKNHTESNEITMIQNPWDAARVVLRDLTVIQVYL